MVRTCDVGFVPSFHAAIRGSSFVRDTYCTPARHTPDLAKVWQEEFLNDGGGPFPKRSPVSLFAQKHRREPLSGASTACPTPRSVTPVTQAASMYGGSNDLHSQWIEVSAQQQRPMSARPQSAGGRRAQADAFEYRLGTPRPPSAQFAEEHARGQQVEFRAKTLGREYCGESWLRRIERRVDKAATPVTILDPQAQRLSRVFQSRGPESSPSRGQRASQRGQHGSNEKDDGVPSDMLLISSGQQVTNVSRYIPKPVVRTRTQKQQMGSGRKAKLADGTQPYADLTEAQEAFLLVRTAERHTVEKRKEDSASRQLSVLHPVCPRYQDLATESSQIGVEWTLAEDHLDHSISVEEQLLQGSQQEAPGYAASRHSAEATDQEGASMVDW